MTYKILQVKVKRPGDQVEVEIDWVKQEGYRLTVNDPEAGPPDVRYYARLSSALWAAAPIIKKLET